MSTNPKENALVVLAIDFGTTYSGYAYSFLSEYKEDHTKIYSNTVWKSGDGLQTSKTPTVILFNKDKKFDSFGYAAETKYKTLQEDDKADGWRFFRLFKMSLYTDKTRRTISKDLVIEDDQKQPMSALIVFAESIRFLKDHFLTSNQVNGFNFENKDVHYVLTIPAIWEDRAKQFMRKAAEQAGIPSNMLTLAYEPEAAAIYCKELTVQKKDGAGASSLSSFEPGQQFLVLDCGGGTVDVTAYQIQNDGNLRELERPTGGPWGGTMVDKKYMEFLGDLFGQDVWKKFSLHHQEDLLEVERKFEAKKKSVEFNSDDEPTIPFPNELFTIYKEGRKCDTVEQGLQKSKFASSVRVKKEKLRFDCKLFKDFFKDAVDAIAQHVGFLLKKSKLKDKDVKTILMVGGFSDSSILSKRIMTEFKGVNVICPHDAVNVIVKGAVIYGHNPNIISERISPRTYGISVIREFNPEIHPKKLRAIYDGKEMCTDIFQPIVHIDHPILVGETIFKHKCYPTRANDTEATVEIYESDFECPQYCTTECGVRRLGDLTVSLPDISKGKNRPIVIEVLFGYTEFKVSAVEEGTTNVTEATFNCLLT